MSTMTQALNFFAATGYNCHFPDSSIEILEDGEGQQDEQQESKITTVGKDQWNHPSLGTVSLPQRSCYQLLDKGGGSVVQADGKSVGTVRKIEKSTSKNDVCNMSSHRRPVPLRGDSNDSQRSTSDSSTSTDYVYLSHGSSPPQHLTNSASSPDTPMDEREPHHVQSTRVPQQGANNNHAGGDTQGTSENIPASEVSWNKFAFGVPVNSLLPPTHAAVPSATMPLMAGSIAPQHEHFFAGQPNMPQNMTLLPTMEATPSQSPGQRPGVLPGQASMMFSDGTVAPTRGNQPNGLNVVNSGMRIGNTASNNLHSGMPPNQMPDMGVSPMTASVAHPSQVSPRLPGHFGSSGNHSSHLTHAQQRAILAAGAAMTGGSPVVGGVQFGNRVAPSFTSPIRRRPQPPRRSQSQSSPSDDGDEATKFARDASKYVQMQFAMTQRHGQACNLCKVRKIKCDTNALGCKHCEKIGQPCEDLDRLTGKSVLRGHAVRLARRIERLEERNEELQRQIDDERAGNQQQGSLSKAATAAERVRDNTALSAEVAAAVARDIEELCQEELRPSLDLPMSHSIFLMANFLRRWRQRSPDAESDLATDLAVDGLEQKIDALLQELRKIRFPTE